MICFGAPSAAGSAFPLPAAHPCCDVSSKLRLQQARPLVDEAEDVSRLVTELRARGCHFAVLGMIGHAAANSQELFSPFFLRCKTMWFTPESPRYVMNMKGYDAGIEVLKNGRRGDVSAEAREVENEIAVSRSLLSATLLIGTVSHRHAHGVPVRRWRPDLSPGSTPRSSR